MLGFDFWAQLVIVLVALFYGARKGGMALGLIGGIGLIILVFGFHLKPGKPPVDVILTILSVICASAALQAAGGLDCLLQIAEKMLRKHPRAVCFLAPYLCWFLALLCGTGHVVYTMLPIIYDVAIKNGIRPERPMAASTIASQMSIICSPAAVAAVSMIALCDGYQVGGKAFGFIQLFSITIPGALVGLFAISVFGMFPELRPIIGKKALSMTLIIQMFMLACGAFIVIFCKTRASSIGKTPVFSAGCVAITAVFGVAWMADTMFAAHLADLKAVMTEIVRQYPWAYALVLILTSKLVNSQAAAVATIVPVALSIGVPPGLVVSCAAACYGYYILPTYPSDLAALQFDRSGTTHIGRFVINHSFILPGLIGVLTATATGYVLGLIYGFI